MIKVQIQNRYYCCFNIQYCFCLLQSPLWPFNILFNCVDCGYGFWMKIHHYSRRIEIMSHKRWELFESASTYYLLKRIIITTEYVISIITTNVCCWYNTFTIVDLTQYLKFEASLPIENCRMFWKCYCYNKLRLHK